MARPAFSHARWSSRGLIQSDHADGVAASGIFDLAAIDLFNLSVIITSHVDYWDFICVLVGDKQFLRRPLQVGLILGTKVGSIASGVAATLT